MTSNHLACPRELVQGMDTGKWTGCEACEGACIDVRDARRGGF